MAVTIIISIIITIIIIIIIIVFVVIIASGGVTIEDIAEKAAIPLHNLNLQPFLLQP